MLAQIGYCICYGIWITSQDQNVQLDVPEFSQQYITYYGIDVSTLIMDAKTMVTATPNTIAMVSDTIISGADVFNLEVNRWILFDIISNGVICGFNV